MKCLILLLSLGINVTKKIKGGLGVLPQKENFKNS